MTSTVTSTLKDLKLGESFHQPEDPNPLQSPSKVLCLDQFDFFLSWVPATANVNHVNHAKKAFKELQKEFDEMAEDNGIDIQYSPMRYISKKLIQTFLAVILYRKEDEGIGLAYQNTASEWIQTYCKEEMPSGLEYKKGFNYLLEGIKILRKIAQYALDEESEEAQYELTELKNYYDSLNSLISVLAVHQLYNGMIQENSFQEEKQILKQMLEEDPLYFEWPYRMHRVLQHERHEHSEFLPPKDEEIDILFKALSLAPNNPFVLLGFCGCLAEFLRKFNPNDSDIKLINFGSKKRFSGVRHAVNFLKEEALKIGNLNPISLKLNLGVVTLFSSTLPFWCRDNKITKQCLERALVFHPKSSRAHVRRGMFALTTERNVKVAQVYLEISYHLNPEDFSALTSVLLCSLNEPEVNHIYINGIFNQELGSEKWSDEENAALYYIKGLYAVLRKEHFALAMSWISAMDYSKEQLLTYIEKIGSLKKRFRLPTAIDEELTILNFLRLLNLCQDVPAHMAPKIKAVRSLVKQVGRLSVLRNHELRDRNEGSLASPPRPFQLYGDYGEGVNEKESAGKLGEAYEILGVQRNSSKEVIARAYSRMCQSAASENLGELAGEELKTYLRKMTDLNLAFFLLLPN